PRLPFLNPPSSRTKFQEPNAKHSYRNLVLGIWFLVLTFRSYCFRPTFACADAQAVFQRQDEDFAIANATLGAGAAGLHDGVDRGLDEILIDGDLKLNLTQQVHCQFMSTINLRMPFLAAEPLHLHDGQT